MSYSDAQSRLQDYHKRHIDGLRECKVADSWFTSMWDAVSTMLKTFGTDAENKAISSSYGNGTPHKKRVQMHFKHDYVCGLRREVRKQYVSGDDEVYTDVTPFRYGVTSANGAFLFNFVMNQIVDSKAGGSK